MADRHPKQYPPERLAEEIAADMRALSVPNTPNQRAVRKRYSALLASAGPDLVLDAARTLITEYGFRWVAYELIAHHREAFRRVGEAELEELGRGMESWGAVDAFGRILSGPAWLRGQVSDTVIARWARSDDLWWRRAALVSTVALNVRSHGGTGDAERMLAVCGMLMDDREDMVVKAMSWALRELAVHDPRAVRAFLDEHEHRLAARVKREVRNKLATGLKNPGR